MRYEPSFTEMIVVLALVMWASSWAARRDPRARTLAGLAVLAAIVGVGAGAVGVSTEQVGVVQQARIGAMSVEFMCLVGAAAWAVAVRRWPVIDDETETPPPAG